MITIHTRVLQQLKHGQQWHKTIRNARWWDVCWECQRYGISSLCVKFNDSPKTKQKRTNRSAIDAYALLWSSFTSIWEFLKQPRIVCVYACVHVCALHLESRVLYWTNVNKKEQIRLKFSGNKQGTSKDGWMETVKLDQKHTNKNNTLCAYQFSSIQTELGPSTANIDTKCFLIGSFSSALHHSEILWISWKNEQKVINCLKSYSYLNSKATDFDFSTNLVCTHLWKNALCVYSI